MEKELEEKLAFDAWLDARTEEPGKEDKERGDQNWRSQRLPKLDGETQGGETK